MKRLFILLLVLTALVQGTQAVLKEKDLEQTLSVLRSELAERHQELSSQMNERRQQNQQLMDELMATVKRSNQNSLMLYSQKPNYVFDLTYACHEATALYRQFQKQQLPFRTFLEENETELAKYDSLIISLRHIPTMLLSQQGKIDCNVCLTLASNIRHTLAGNSSQTASYMNYYEQTELMLKRQNDYAQERYNEIQTGIFLNGGKTYHHILGYLKEHWSEMKWAVKQKYSLDNASDTDSSANKSQWGAIWIFGLFVVIAFYIVVATVLNLLVFRFLLPKRMHTKEFLKKRTSIIMATTTVTFALLAGIFLRGSEQNFLNMASNLLIEFAWLLAVILISLLLRVTGNQINSALRIYAPLVVVGFIVIGFRIILIPNQLVNLIFPPILIASTLWQWIAVTRHNQNIPQQDMFYTYISLTVFIVSSCCSWMGYTLLAVQILIWWIMQLTCILTITCLSRWLKLHGIKKGIEKKPITKSWFYLFIYKVVLPVMGVLSVMLSIYWAADVFNLNDLCWTIFRKHFIDMANLQLSILKLCMVVILWFFFSYFASTLLAFMRLHFERQDPTTAASREAMSRNVLQVLVWGIWLIMSLSILHISLTWLLAISGGLSTGIGFASKNIIENIFYGASLMAGRLKVGDWIEVDGTMGKVQQISYTSTSVESLYGEIITFQNSQLFDKNYKNLTKNHGYVLAAIPFGVAYGSDLRQVQQVVEDAVNGLKHKWMDSKKKAKSVVTTMNDSSIDLKLFVWVDAPKKSYVVSEVLRCIYDTLRKNNIEIPFPQRDITIKNATELLGTRQPGQKKKKAEV